MRPFLFSMAKDLPYFKFDAAEWINGNITLEDFYLQGVFINVCAYYWFKSGDLKLTEIKRRLTNIQPTALDSLIKAGLIHVTDDKIRICFLDEQLAERNKISLINSQNGKKGGAPKGNTNNRKSTESQPKSSNIEKRREEEREKSTPPDGKVFVTIAKRYANEKVQKIYNLQNYFESTQQLNSLQVSGWVWFEEFMKANSGKVFNEPDHLYNTFRNFCLEYKPPARAPNKFETAEYNKTLWTTEAWEKAYSKQLEDPEFRQHFGYGKLHVSKAMGS